MIETGSILLIGMVVGLFGSLTDAIGNIFSGNLLSLDNWGSDWGYDGDSLKSYSGFTSRNQLSVSSSSSGVVSNTDTKGMQQSIVDEQSDEAENIRGDDSEEDSEVIIILRELKKFFEGGGSAIAPLKVSIVSNSVKDIVNNNLTLDKDVMSVVQPLDLVTIVNEILNRLLVMGTTSSPVVSSLIAGAYPTYGTGSGIVPEPTI